MSEPLKRHGLLAALRQDEAALVDVVKAMPEEAFARGVYENGWSAKELLAHLAAIEWTYPRLIEVSLQAPTAGSAEPSRPPRGGMEGYNAREVARRAERTVAELLEEFRRNRAATIAAIEALDESSLARPVRSAGGRTGTLLEVLHGVAVEHVRGHLSDLNGGAEVAGTGVIDGMA